MRSRRLAGRGFLAAYRLASRARAKGWSVLAAGAFASFGENTVLQPPIRLSGERRMAIGSNVFVGGGSWLQVIEGAQNDDVALRIGDGTSIAGGCVLSAISSITLGRRVLLARNVYISDHAHAFERAGEAVLDQGLDRVAPVFIGDGAWLGQNVVVTPGVRVGEGAVVGANSVVLADVPAHAVAVGAPARVVRSLASRPEAVR